MADLKRSQLFDSSWQYSERPMVEFNRADWEKLNLQREIFYKHSQVNHAFQLLSSMKNDYVFGYPKNPYRHCLQSATKIYRDGHDLQIVVTGLFHDVGFSITPSNHGEFAAALLKPNVSEKTIGC